MGFYAEKILPPLLDRVMANPDFVPYRQATLANVTGEVLEIGFGTGLNLSYYPPALQHLVTVDANPGVSAIAQTRIAQSPITVDLRVLNGERLPMPDATFDSVVSTWTLCSIRNVDQALREIYRVLKPGGHFFFVEHGLSEERSVQVWQNRLTPIQKIIADGCHLNRNIRAIVAQHFDRLTITTEYAPKTPKFAGYFYQGVATKKL